MSNIKSIQKVSGIYKITNKTNGKYYIGSSDNIHGSSGRWMEHIRTLKTQTHSNVYLQRSWNKYGESNFEFSILEEVPKENLLIVEQKYLDKAKLDYHKQCYNLTFCASGGGNFGKNHSEETKRKISEKLKGRIVSDNTRKLLSCSLIGRTGGFVEKTQTKEWSQNQSKRHREFWKQKRFENPMYGKGKQHPQYREVNLIHNEELKQFYLKYGSMKLYQKGREFGYGKGTISKFIKTIKTELGISSNVHLTDKRHVKTNLLND